jgi:hypothetical protein
MTNIPDHVLFISKGSDSSHRRIIVYTDTTARFIKQSEVPPLAPPR